MAAAVAPQGGGSAGKEPLLDMDLRIDRRELLKRGAIMLGSLALAGTMGALFSSSQANPSRRRGPPPYVTAVGKGCDPTGARVCSRELNEMLAEAAGGSAWLEDGTYLFDEPLIVPPDTRLDGHGTLKLADRATLSSTAGAVVLGSNCTVRGITVDGNKTNQFGDGAMIFGAQLSGIRIVDVSIVDAPGRSIYLYRCAASQINGCDIERGGLTEATDGSCASVSTLRSSYVQVTNNTITESAGEGIFLGCGDALVANNNIRNAHSIGIAVGGGRHRNIVISHNYVQIDRTWLAPDGVAWPNCVDIADSSDCLVTGNHTEGGACGVQNAPPSYRTRVVDNTCGRAVYAGVSMVGAGSFEPVDLVISGNICVDNGQEGIGVAYVASAEVQDNECMDNGQSTVYPHTAGILVYGDDTGGYINGLVIERNRCGDQQGTTTQLYGILVQGARNANIWVLDNNLRGNGISPVRDTSMPGSAVYSGNVG